MTFSYKRVKTMEKCEHAQAEINMNRRELHMRVYLKTGSRTIHPPDVSPPEGAPPDVSPSDDSPPG